MLSHENKLRNRAHRNRLRQIDGLPGGPLPGVGADGDGEDEEEQPPVGGGAGPTTTPGAGTGQTPTTKRTSICNHLNFDFS